MYAEVAVYSRDKKGLSNHIREPLEQNMTGFCIAWLVSVVVCDERRTRVDWPPVIR